MFLASCNKSNKQTEKKVANVNAFLVGTFHFNNFNPKNTTKKEGKIMILEGASHLGMFKDFVDKNPEWKTTELKEIME